jgi:hypothetical protein
MTCDDADVTDVVAGPWITTRRHAETALQVTLANVTDGLLTTPDRSTPNTRGPLTVSGSGDRRISLISVIRLTEAASRSASLAPARPPMASAIDRNAPRRLRTSLAVPDGQAGDLLGERPLGARIVAAQEPVDP